MTALWTLAKERRAALLPLAAIFFAMCVFVVVPAVLAFRAQSEDTRQALHQLAVYRAEAGIRPALERELKEARQRLSSVPGQIAGTNAPLAQAALQSDVKALVDRNGGNIVSAQIVPTTKTDGFETISVQYDLVVPVTRLSDLMYAIESHTPYLFIDGASISMPQIWQPGDAQAAEPKVEVRWTIHGYRWVGGK